MICRSDYELQQKSFSSLSELKVCQSSDTINPFSAHTVCQDDAMRCDKIIQTLTLDAASILAPRSRRRRRTSVRPLYAAVKNAVQPS